MDGGMRLDFDPVLVFLKTCWLAPDQSSPDASSDPSRTNL